MADAPQLDWDQLLDLHVVRKVSKLASRRWNLGVGYVDAVSGAVVSPKTNSFARFRGPCQVLQESSEGRKACSDFARRTLERFATEAVRGVIRSRPITLSCHAGLTEIAAPILVDGQFFGALLCGGFLLEEQSSDGIGEMAAIHPRLSSREVSIVGELVEEAASEIASYLRTHGSAKDLLGESQGRQESARQSYGKIIGASAPMQVLYNLLDKVVASDSTVLITGENGTGKELVASAIHHNSKRKNERFVVQNCSAFNDNLLDSELFGHKRGAFTGAVSDKKGLFEVAHKGTFFLDEIGDMSPALQVKVLRVLQEGTFTPVGSTETKKVDVRVVAATNRDLRAMVKEGTFREDLYYRINVINLCLPALRERPDDIELLAKHFLSKHSGEDKRIGNECLAHMLTYAWPGNVRELENEIERLVVLSGDSPVLSLELLSSRMQNMQERRASDIEGPVPTGSLPEAVRRLEIRMIRDALLRHGWNKTRAAADLQISRRNLIRLVQKYDLERDRKLEAN